MFQNFMYKTPVMYHRIKPEEENSYYHGPRSACHVPMFFTGERVWQRIFLQVFVTGIVTKHKQKIPF